MNITENEIESIRFHLDCAMRLLGRVVKRQNAKNSSKKAKENGSRLGRNRAYNYADIVKLHEKGMTYRDVAKAIGCSTTVVQRAVKDNEVRK